MKFLGPIGQLISFSILTFIAGQALRLFYDNYQVPIINKGFNNPGPILDFISSSLYGLTGMATIIPLTRYWQVKREFEQTLKDLPLIGGLAHFFIADKDAAVFRAFTRPSVLFCILGGMLSGFFATSPYQENSTDSALAVFGLFFFIVSAFLLVMEGIFVSGRRLFRQLANELWNPEKAKRRYKKSLLYGNYRWIWRVIVATFLGVGFYGILKAGISAWFIFLYYAINILINEYRARINK